MSSIIEITKTFKFEASHVLPKHRGKCSRLHGHSWELTVGVSGEVDPESGFVMDYAELKTLVTQEVIDHVDHSHLGCGIAYHGDEGTAHSFFGSDFYPSSENLVIAIAAILQPLINTSETTRYLSLVSLKETCTSEATWRPVTQQ